MAIALRSSSTTAYGSRTNTTVTVPTGAATGDVIVIAFAVGNSSSVTPSGMGAWSAASCSFNAPDPWTVNLYLWVKPFVSGETSYTVTHASGYSQAYATAWTGVDTTNPLDVTPGTATQNYNVSGTKTVTAPGITTTTAGCMGISARGSWDGNAITPPVNWTEDSDTPVLWFGHRTYAASGTTGTFTLDSGNNDNFSPWGVIHAALRPASGATNYNGTASLSGTGSVSAGGVVAKTSTAALTGVGSVAAAGSVARTGTASVTGSGSVSATGVLGVESTATIPGSGGVTATGQAGGAAALTGAGTVAAAGTVGEASTAGVAGTGSVTATGVVGTSNSATVTGTGALVAAGTAATGPSATITGTGSVAAAGVVGVTGAAALAGTGTLTAAGTSAAGPSATIAGVGTIAAAGVVGKNAPATIIAVGTIDATSQRASSSLATITGAGVVAAAGVVVEHGGERDITVNGTLGPSRWAGTIRTRWEGHL